MISAERNIQMLVYLMKKHGIRHVIASPGATNVTFVATIQNDPYFKVYSCVDERSAAYIACGMAVETGEPIAISCTGATASRNYMPALTEAYYRKIPILAITAAQHECRLNQLIPQAIDRRSTPPDLVYKSVQIPQVYSEDDEWGYGVKINDALLELYRHGGGPVHINLTTAYNKDYSIKEIKPVKVIRRYEDVMSFPCINKGRIAIFIGAHSPFNETETEAIEAFCSENNGVVLCDRTSNYFGNHRVLPSILCNQQFYNPTICSPDLLIHIGTISGAYLDIFPREVWRVSEDGEIHDTFRKLTNVFECKEKAFFSHYVNNESSNNSISKYCQEWREQIEYVRYEIAELPFSNIWVAKNTINRLNEHDVLHLGILNSLRSWNYFDTEEKLKCFCNTGGFGIDGCVSTLIGASLANNEKLYFGVVGDLAFFYDMNSIGNRHIGNNLRLIVINNGIGTEFKNYSHEASRFGADSDKYIAAGGHFGQQSKELLKNYTQSLGFEYLSASNKSEFLSQIDHFTDHSYKDKSIIFEIFTSSNDESDALKIINNSVKSASSTIEESSKKIIKGILGDKRVKELKRMIRK